MRPIARLAVVAAALLASAAPASAQVYWGGVGMTGTDPFGQEWRIDDDNVDPLGARVLAFGIPGLGAGAAIWPATAPTLTSFQIRFAGGSPLLPDVDVSNLFATRLLSGKNFIFWDASVSSDLTTATFTSPAGGQIDPGDRWFVNVVFVGRDAPTSFEAVYNGTLDTTATPEPATVALVAAGLGVVGIVARRRRRLLTASCA